VERLTVNSLEKGLKDFIKNHPLPENIKWVKCKVCGKEYSNLFPDCKCLTCKEKEKAELRIQQELKEQENSTKSQLDKI